MHCPIPLQRAGTMAGRNAVFGLSKWPQSSHCPHSISPAEIGSALPFPRRWNAHQARASPPVISIAASRAGFPSSSHRSQPGELRAESTSSAVYTPSNTLQVSTALVKMSIKREYL
jgi:hypothetical protein